MASKHLDLTQQIRTACLLEATARKPGNVHPEASFADLTYDDFVRSADCVAPILAQSRKLGVGRAILDASVDTREAVGRNTNLGIILLLAPLAAVDPATSLRDGIAPILDSLKIDDSRCVYRAIAAAQPGGMGRVEDEDVSAEPTRPLVEIMHLAADRDAIARQYTTAFDLVLGMGLDLLARETDFPNKWELATVRLHLELMARCPDTLIARKCGQAEADESAARAKDVLNAGGPTSERGRAKLQQLDAWLREKGNRRNPGTTADLVTACLFAALREGVITRPAISEIRMPRAEARRRGEEKTPE